jgi:hypothetical protein
MKPSLKILATCLAATEMFAVSFLTAAEPSDSPQVDGESLRQKLVAHQRARQAASDLVSNILAVQLQQLEENGLQGLPLYGDIAQMRTNIDGLVESSMGDVVGLLASAQHAPAAEREKTFVAARQKIRDVVGELSVERQNLSRRLKMAELAAAVKQLLALEWVAIEETRSLARTEPSAKSQVATAALQDQREIAAHLERFMEMLGKVSEWEGSVGKCASDCTTIVRSSRVAESIEASVTQLAREDYVAAEQSQASVLNSLRFVLETIEKAQGVADASRDIAVELTSAIVRKQEQLRNRLAGLNAIGDAELDALVADQTAIQKEIERLRGLLKTSPQWLPFVERARDGAYTASGRIFESDRLAAIREQSKVIGSLGVLEQQLRQQMKSPDTDRSSDEWNTLLEKLEKAIVLIRDGTDTFHQVRRTPNQSMSALRANCQPVVDALTQEMLELSLPDDLSRGIVEAGRAVREAAESLDDPEAEPGRVGRLFREAEVALERAGSELQIAADDARCQRSVARVAELACAAELLEGAAALTRRTINIEAGQKERDTGLRNLVTSVATVIQTAVPQFENVRESPTAESLTIAAHHARRAAVQTLRKLVEETSTQLTAVMEVYSMAERELGTKDARRIGELAGRCPSIDATALRSLREAERLAIEAKQLPADSPAILAVEQNLQRSFERAVASLAAVQHRLDHEEKLAETLLTSMTALDESIALIASERDRVSEDVDTLDAEVATRLAEAMRRFESSRADFEKALEDASDRRPMANASIRKALAAVTELIPVAEAGSHEVGSEHGSPLFTARMVAGDRLMTMVESVVSADSTKSTPTIIAQGTTLANGAAATSASSSGSSTTGAASPLPGRSMFREQPWMAKLPPSVREAITGRSRRPPPKEYEDRLRRYFESLE